jgi:ribosomal protein L7/L12
MVSQIARYFARSSPANRSPQEIFDAKVADLNTNTAKLFANIDPEKLQFFETAAQAIDGLDENEKRYLMFRYLREDPDVSLGHLRTGLALKNAFETERSLSSGFGRANKDAGSDKEAPKPVAEAPKEEEKKIKATADLEYKGCDPAKKLGAIKEIKSMMGIGLKEAKELVEGGQSTLKKAIKREEAEELAAKLTAIGCIVAVI